MSQSVIEETQAPPVGAEEIHKGPTCYKKEIGPENFIFIVLFVAFFALFAAKALLPFWRQALRRTCRSQDCGTAQRLSVPS